MLYIATCKMGINRVVQFQFKPDTGSDAIEKVTFQFPRLSGQLLTLSLGVRQDPRDEGKVLAP